MSDLPIGTIAARTGLSVPTIRFYETHGIITPGRNAGGHRRYSRADIRRLSFAMAAQRLGFPLAQIAAHLAALPTGTAPTRADWTRIATGFRAAIAQRIAALQDLTYKLDGCIGCGCLSLDRCALYNPADSAAAEGAGPRRLKAP